MADIYHIWANKKQGISDKDFADGMRHFLQQLQDEGKMISFRITRSKLGFRSIQDLPEWHIMMEFDNMAQLDEAFTRVVPQQGELEKKHVSFNKYVEDDIQHALYRDWPDAVNKAKLTDQQPQVKIKPIDPELEKRMKGSWTVEEIVESMKRSYPEIWKK